MTVVMRAIIIYVMHMYCISVMIDVRVDIQQSSSWIHFIHFKYLFVYSPGYVFEIYIQLI